jgi:hypothetical protein
MNDHYRDREYHDNEEKVLDSHREYLKEGELSYLPVEELKPLYLYRLHARNSRFGVWHPERKVFVISRFKFQDNFLCQELHWDTEDPWGGTAKPLRELEKTPFKLDDFKNNRLVVMNYLNQYDQIKCTECGRLKNEWVVHESWCSNRTK